MADPLPPITLEKVSPAPVKDDPFSGEFVSWLSVTVDTLNEVIQKIQDRLNLLL